MAKTLGGSELADFIKERQAKQVRMLRQAHGIIPKLLILKVPEAKAVIETYVRMKQRYAEDILIETEVVTCPQSDMIAAIKAGNARDDVYGIIVQLPLADTAETDAIVAHIAPNKDVDGLGSDEVFVSATAEAIDWLISGHGIELAGKKIAILGNGKLVGAPLAKLWATRGLAVTVFDEDSPAADGQLRDFQLIVSATGVPGLIQSADIAPDTVIIDAGTASENGVIVGDIDPDVYSRKDVRVTPQKGGVGPLTIVLMFDHVIRACLARINTVKKTQ